jgi:hypothetical protein
MLLQVKELENAAVELLATYEDCTHFSSAIHSVGDRCQPVGEVLELDIMQSFSLRIILSLYKYFIILLFSDLLI